MFFRRNQKQESSFQQVGSLVTIFFFCFLFIASHALLQIPNPKEFYEGIFLQIIPVRIIVSRLNLFLGKLD